MPDEDRVVALLRALLPPKLAEPLMPYLDDIPFLAEQVKLYLEADEDGKADIEAFLDSGGIAQVKRAAEKAQGTPSAEELGEWMGEADHG